MSLTRTELCAELKSIFGRTDIDSRIQKWLNLAQIELVKVHEFQDLNGIYEGTTTADINYYSFPTRMKDIHTFRLIDGVSSRKLIRILPTQLDKYIPAPEEKTTGRSSYYVRYSSHFELYRIPDDAYTLRLRASFWLTPFSTDSQTCDLTYVDNLLISKSAEIGWRSIQQADEAKEWGRSFNYEVGVAAREDGSVSDRKLVAQGFRPLGEQVLTGERTSNPLYGMGRR